MSTWLIGAVMAASGSVASNLGVNCQKFSFMQNAKLPKPLQRRHIRQKGWLLGMGLIVIGAIADFIALSLAAQSIVAPIGSITLVANVFFAHYWLKEKVGWVELMGTSMIVTGSVLAVTFGDHSDVTYDIHAILSFFLGLTFIVYAVLTVALGAALYRFQLPITPTKQKIVDATKRYELAYEANNRQAMDYEDFYIASLQNKYAKWERVHPFTVCALSGILGGQSVMFAMLACVVGQLQYLAIALSFFDALYVVPVFQCFFIAFSTLGGACFFNEFGSFQVVQAVMFPIGLLTTLGGVIVLTRRKMGDAERKRFLLGEEETASDSMEREEMEVIEEGDEGAGEEAEEESEVLKMEKRREREERKRRRRLRKKRQKSGYEGLYDADEEEEEEEEDTNLSSDLSEDDTEAEEEQEGGDEDRRPLYSVTMTGETDKVAEEAKMVQPPSSSPARQSPIRRLSNQPSHSPPTSTASTPSSRGPSRSSSPRPRDPTPLPLIDDMMAASLVVTGGAAPAVLPSSSPPGPVASADRRSSLTAVLPTTERRSSMDRRQSLPRRPSHSPRVPVAIAPPALHITTGDDGTTATPPAAPAVGTISAPSTPPSLSRHGSVFRPGTSSPSALSFMQPSVAQYLPPPTGMDLWTKEEKLQQKVKKYSSLAHHAGGLVGVPIVSAIAHAWVIGKEEREEEVREKRAAAAEMEEKRREEEKKGDEKKETQPTAEPTTETRHAEEAHTADSTSTVEMETIAGHRYGDEYAVPTTSSAIVIPVAEPVNLDTAAAPSAVPGPSAGSSSSEGPFFHHGHSGSVMHRLKDRIRHAFEHHPQQSQPQREPSSDAGEGEEMRMLEEGTAVVGGAEEEGNVEVGQREEEAQQPLIPAGRGSSDDSQLGLEESVTAGDVDVEPSVSRQSVDDVGLQEEEEEAEAAEEAESAEKALAEGPTGEENVEEPHVPAI